MVNLFELINEAKTVRGAIRFLQERQIIPKNNAEMRTKRFTLVKAIPDILGGDADYENADKKLE